MARAATRGLPSGLLPKRTPRLELRLPRPADAAPLVRAGNFPDVARGTYVPYPLTLDAARTMIARRRRASAEGTALGCVIVDRAEGTVVGMTGLGRVDRHDRSAELYYWLTPRLWGKGLATQAARGVLEIAFGPLRLHRVEAHAHSFNRRSWRLLRGLGFRVEGRLRETRREGRIWRDSWILGLLEDEFARSRPTRRPRRVSRTREPPARRGPRERRRAARPRAPRPGEGPRR